MEKRTIWGIRLFKWGCNYKILWLPTYVLKDIALIVMQGSVAIKHEFRATFWTDMEEREYSPSIVLIPELEKLKIGLLEHRGCSGSLSRFKFPTLKVTAIDQMHHFSPETQIDNRRLNDMAMQTLLAE